MTSQISPESPRTSLSQNRNAYVRIIKQPDSIVRFRYNSEARTTSIRPVLKIYGYTGKVISIVSCVTAEEPHKPHPHQLFGTHHTAGACTVQTTITERHSEISFDIGLQSVKKEDIIKSLKERQEAKVDPYKTGFEHMNSHHSINLNCVKLCFQVFLQNGSTGKFTDSLEPALSDVVYDEKTASDLTIVAVSHDSDSYKGGTFVILLGKRLLRNDIAVVFSRKDGRWQKEARIETVHKQAAITFYTPRYDGPMTSGDLQVNLQLMRTTDYKMSSPKTFKYKSSTDDPLPTRFSDTPEDTKYHENTYRWAAAELVSPSHGNCGPDMNTPQGSPNLMCPLHQQPNMVTATSNIHWNSPNHQSLMLNIVRPHIYQRTNGITPETPLSMDQASPSMPMSMEQVVSPSMEEMPMSMEQVVSPSMEEMPMSMEQASPSVNQIHGVNDLVLPTMEHMTPNLMQKQITKDRHEKSCQENRSDTILLVNSDDSLPQLNSGLTNILGSCEDLSDSLSKIFL